MSVTTDSNGVPYCTECGQRVEAHRGNTPRRLGSCPPVHDSRLCAQCAEEEYLA